MGNILHFAVIFTFALGIIAPACGFAWGGSTYSVIEICTNNGIEKIAVKDETPSGDHQTQDPCQFCFNHTHLTKDFVSPQTVTLLVNFTTHQYFQTYQTALLQALHHDYQSRAPPAFL